MSSSDEDVEEEEEEEQSEKGEDDETVAKIEEEESIEDLVGIPLTYREAVNCLCKLGVTSFKNGAAYVMISATHRNLEDISVIPLFRNVMYVDVSGNLLTEVDLEVLTDMSPLLGLRADRNKLMTMCITPVEHLKTLTVNFNKIFTTEYIKHPDLQTLQAQYNRIKELKGFDSMYFYYLQILDVRGNEITHIDELDLPHLKELYLPQNKIQSLVGIDRMKHLRILHLRSNPLASLKGFSENNEHLQYINFRHCQIKNEKQFKRLVCLLELETLIVSDNPVTSGEAAGSITVILSFFPRLKRLNKVAVTHLPDKFKGHISFSERVSKVEFADEATE